MSISRPSGGYLRRSTLLFLALIACGAVGSALGWGVLSRTYQSPGELAALVERAVNAGDTVTMESLTAPGIKNDYRWVREWRQSGNFKRWKAGPVSVYGSQRTLLHISRLQVVQSTYDHLYEIAGPSSRPRLGREIPEDELVGCRVTDHHITVTFDPARRHVTVTDRAKVTTHADRWSVALVRLNAQFSVFQVTLDDAPTPWRQFGGFIMVPRPAAQTATLTLTYEATLPKTGETFMSDKEAALTAYWYAHTGRLPATSEIEVRAPQDWLAIAPGERQSGSSSAVRWKNLLPVSFITVAAGKYSVTRREVGGVTLNAYLLRPSATRAREVLDQAQSAIEVFGHQIAPFPYSGYTVVESDIFPAALEAYSFTLCGRETLPGVVVHEVSHTWWGGLVPNTYTRSMWNEAFATYSEGLHRRLAGAGPDDPTGHGARTAGNTLPTALPLSKVTDAMNSTHAAIGYTKGAHVLGQLERMIGPDRMRATLRALVTRHRRGDAADWSDFQAAVTATNGTEWAECLDAWLNDPRIPSFGLSGVRVSRSGSGYEITGTVTVEPVGFWALIPLTAGGNEPTSTAVLCRGSATPFRFQSRAAPEVVTLDPDGVVLRTGGDVRAALTDQ